MIYLAGLNHRTAPLELREKFHLPEKQLPEALVSLSSCRGVSEAVIISTCNRTELVLNAAGEAEGAEAVAGFIAALRPQAPNLLNQHGYTHSGTQAVRHIFRVASSLDSMILGEPQILGQVKAAYAAARAAGTVGAALSGLMQKSFACAKRVRSETQISRSPVSIASAATDLAGQIFGELEEKSVLVLGAGKMGALTTRHLVSRGVKRVCVANRTYEVGLKLAREFGGEVLPFDEFVSRLSTMDVLIVSTAAREYVLNIAQAPEILKARRHRPLFIVDLSVPRNVDPAMNTVNNIFLYDVDSLKDLTETGKSERRAEAVRAESLIEEELVRYATWVKSDQVKPTILDLRRKYRDLAGMEMEKLRSRMGEMSPDQARALDEGVSAIVNKMLHAPTAELKGLLKEKNGFHMVELARKLFRLDGSEPASIGGANPEEIHGKTDRDPPDSESSSTSRVGDIPTRGGETSR
jgi:glutamyl-tRNA reductase